MLLFQCADYKRQKCPYARRMMSQAGKLQLYIWRARCRDSWASEERNSCYLAISHTVRVQKLMNAYSNFMWNFSILRYPYREHNFLSDSNGTTDTTTFSQTQMELRRTQLSLRPKWSYGEHNFLSDPNGFTENTTFSQTQTEWMRTELSSSNGATENTISYRTQMQWLGIDFIPNLTTALAKVLY